MSSLINISSMVMFAVSKITLEVARTPLKSELPYSRRITLILPKSTKQVLEAGLYSGE